MMDDDPGLSDSYRVATESAMPDDNRTAMGHAKSYRKTPYSSRYFSKDAINRGATIDTVDHALGKDDEHKLLLNELFARYMTDPTTGLSDPQAEANLQLYGPNEILSSLQTPEWVRFCKSMFGGSSFVLWIGAILCFINFSIQSGINEYPPLDNVWLGIVFLIVMLFTGLISFFQESKQASIVREYRQLFPQMARVIRNMEECEIPSEDLVIGDIVLLRYGDVIPADCRIIDSHGFMVDMSPLTGESEAQERSTHFTHDQKLLSHNMIFYGTYAVHGSCKAVVVATGLNTIMGQLADLAATSPRKSTLITSEISKFMHLITSVAIFLGTFFFIIAFLLGYYWIDAIIFLIGVIAACVPEGFMAVMTICLSLSAKRLQSRHSIIKNLEAIETLGSTSVIICDKTGTLTKNKPTVAHVWIDNSIGEIDTGPDDRPGVSFDLKSDTWFNLARIAMLANNAEFANSESYDEPILKRDVIGTPIEAALLRSVEALVGNTGNFRSKFPKVAEIPFSPLTKFQLSINECPDTPQNGYLMTMIGDPDAVLTRCSSILINGQDRPVDDQVRMLFHDACNQLGGLGERLIALCDSRLSPRKYPPGFQFHTVGNINFPLSGFRLVGIMSMIDPPRAAAPDSIAKCQAAGIKVIMVTGDHVSTARAIAKSVGILSMDENPLDRHALLQPAHSCIVTGEEAMEMTQDELDSVLMHHQEIIFAEFTAEQKLSVVDSCQRLGAVVAVTGDGVNDAPALRQADIGIAMGTGSDVAKQAADMILLNDDFASVVQAVEEGRIMFDNLKKCMFYILCSNVPELAAFFMYLIAQIPLPLGVLAVLCIDLGTDMLPAISLAFEEEEHEHEVMKRGPRNPKSEGLIDEKLIFLSCGQIGLIQAAAGFLTYFVIMAENGFWPSRLLGLRVHWDSLAINDLKDSYDQEWTYEDRKSLEYSCHAGFFFSIVIVQWFALIAGRTRKLSVFQKGMGNWVLNFSILFETLLALIIIYLPALNSGLQLRMLNPISWFICTPFVIIVFVYDEIRKAIIRKHNGGFMEAETCF